MTTAVDELKKKTDWHHLARQSMAQNQFTARPVSADVPPVREDSLSSFPAQDGGNKPESVLDGADISSHQEHHSELAAISLILGLLGLILPLFSTLAIIIGIGGLMQAHRGMKGQWMAWVGMVLGLLGILMIIAAIVFGIGFLEDYLLRFGGIETLIGKVKESLVVV